MPFLVFMHLINLTVIQRPSSLQLPSSVLFNGLWKTRSWKPPALNCSAGRSGGTDLCSICSATVPRGLRTHFPGVRSSRQSSNPLAHPQPLLVAVNSFVQDCTICTISKSPRRLPEGKLQPLPIPGRPWSHLGVDFITDLLPVSLWSWINSTKPAASSPLQDYHHLW